MITITRIQGPLRTSIPELATTTDSLAATNQESSWARSRPSRSPPGPCLRAGDHRRQRLPLGRTGPCPSRDPSQRPRQGARGEAERLHLHGATRSTRTPRQEHHSPRRLEEKWGKYKSNRTLCRPACRRFESSIPGQSGTTTRSSTTSTEPSSQITDPDLLRGRSPGVRGLLACCQEPLLPQGRLREEHRPVLPGRAHLPHRVRGRTDGGPCNPDGPEALSTSLRSCHMSTGTEFGLDSGGGGLPPADQRRTR